MRRSRSIRSLGESSASACALNRSSHASSEAMRFLKADAEVSSSFSSYSVSPRLEASVGESSYSSLRKVATREAYDEPTMTPPWRMGWRRQREPHRVPAQTRLQAHAGAEGQEA